ncbi:MAG: fumarylacetoacetate hydrolase family protein [Armatimonadia bacterium]
MSLRLVNFVPKTWPEAAPRVGALIENAIVDIAEACEAADSDCGCAGSVVDLLACPDCLQAAREALAEVGPNVAALPLAEAILLAPVIQPGKLLCLAGNYEEHIREGKNKELSGEVHASDKATPRVFMKPSTNTVCGSEAPVIVGKTSTFVDYEGELAIIIGKRGKYIKAADAMDYVGGVTCLNDISERRLHIWDRPETRQWDRFFDWLNGKWFDNSAPMGPCAVPLADIGDLGSLRLVTRLNGKVMQDASTGQMIFGVPEIVEYISHMVTLEPGDVIATGTPAGVGHSQDIAMHPGDVVEVEIEGIGILRNPVIAEEA